MVAKKRGFSRYVVLPLQSIFHLIVAANIGAVFYGVKDDVTRLVQDYDVTDVLVLRETMDLFSLELHWYPLIVSGFNIFFQTTFLFLALCQDALEWVDKHESRVGRLIKYWQDVVFSGLVVPVTCFVTTMFWSVYSIDRELVFPTVYDQIVPWWFNHCVHTNIFIVICMETLLQARRRPVDARVETICVVTAVVAYAVVYYSIYFFGHRWLYQVFGIMNWWQVCLFQCLIWASSYFFYRIQYPINRLIHGSEGTDSIVDSSYAKGKTTSDSGIQDFDSKIDVNFKGKTISHTDIKQEGDSNTDLNIEEVNKVMPERNEGITVVEGGLDKMERLEKNGSLKGDFKRPAFADRSWSLKYRTIRDQFEKTSL